MVSAARIDRLTARVVEYRLWRHTKRNYEMSRLRDLVAQAAAVAPRQAAKIEERARRIIGSESELEARQDEAFGVHEAILGEAQASLDDLQHALAPLSNNPPLERSTPLPAVSALPEGQQQQAAASGGRRDVQLIRS
jgi:hypothetical protein